MSQVEHLERLARKSRRRAWAALRNLGQAPNREAANRAGREFLQRSDRAQELSLRREEEEAQAAEAARSGSS